jgi:hypothetical protein
MRVIPTTAPKRTSGTTSFYWFHQTAPAFSITPETRPGCGPKIRLVRLAMTPSTSTTNEWVGAWILLHRVKNIQADGSVYAITVEPTAKGFQSIIFRRIAPKMSFRFVDVNGRMVDEVRN